MSEIKNKIKSDKPFWDWMMNIPVVKWFCNLSICKKCMELKIFQMLLNYEIITYIFYGVLTTIVNLAIYYGFYGIFVAIFDSALGVAILNTIAWLVAMLFAFITNKLIVFKSKNISFAVMIKELSAFAIARLASLFMEMIIVVPTAAIFPNSDTINFIAKIIAQIVVVISNYIFSKLFIFKK